MHSSEMPDLQSATASNVAVLCFCELLGWMLGLPAGEAIYRAEYSMRAFTFSGIGLFFVVLGPTWPVMRHYYPQLASSRLVRIASDLRWWLALLLVFFVTYEPGAPALDVRWRTIAENPWLWMAVFLASLFWIGGPRFIERMRAARHAKPPQQRPSSMPKKEVSPENLDGLRAMATVLQSRPVGEEPAKPIVDSRISEKTKPEVLEGETSETAKAPAPSETQSAPLLPWQAQVTELPQESNPEQAIQYFNKFKPDRPMTDLAEYEWCALGTLFSVQIESGAVNGRPWERRYLMLRFLPDSNPVAAYALLLLLYGYWRIYDFADVSANWLEQGLYCSGLRQESQFPYFWPKMQSDRLSVDSVAKFYALDGMISEKFGLAKGGFYKLTHAGARKAQAMFVDLVRRA